MRSNKGFTLIELLAMLVVLGVLMVITVPNISGILKNQRDNTLVEDANRFLNMAKTVVATDKNIKKPSSSMSCIIITLEYADKNNEISKGANNQEYDRYDSFIVMIRNGSSYDYRVRLIEPGNRSIKLQPESSITSFQSLSSKDKENSPVIDDDPGTTLVTESSTKDQIASSLSAFNYNHNICTIENVYMKTTNNY